MVAKLTRRALLLCLALLPACAPEPSPYPRHLVLISIDTLRADHLGCYGRDDAETQNIDRLAEQGRLYERVTAAAPTTLASHTSLFTGRYPRTHGVARNGFVVHPDNEMLPEILKGHGFTTAGFIGSFALDKRFGFDQGFDHFDQAFDQQVDVRNRDQDQRNAAAVTDAVLQWTEGADAERLFLFVHYFDPHASYAPPGVEGSDFADLYRQIDLHRTAILDDPPKRGLTAELVAGASGTPLEGDRRLADLYAQEVAYVDRQIGRLLEGLDKQGILDDALIVLTADHGETFWEHADFWNHGLWVYDTTVHVPWIMQGRGVEPGRTSEAKSNTDILPATLQTLGIPWTAPEGDGFRYSEATQPIGSLEAGLDWPNELKAKAIFDGRYKYVVAPFLRYEELYDLDADPGERSNLLAKPNPDLEPLRDRLRRRLEEWTLEHETLPSHFDEEQRNETLERLKNLGYVGD